MIAPAIPLVYYGGIALFGLVSTYIAYDTGQKLKNIVDPPVTYNPPYDAVSNIENADAAAEKKTKAGTGSITEVCSTCPPPEEEEQDKKKKELEEESILTDDTGKTHNWEKKGTMEDANRDFDDFKPDSVKDIETQFGPGRVGELKDGSHIVVRPGHLGNPKTPTLEIQRRPGVSDKFRYK